MPARYTISRDEAQAAFAQAQPGDTAAAIAARIDTTKMNVGKWAKRLGIALPFGASAEPIPHRSTGFRPTESQRWTERYAPKLLGDLIGQPFAKALLESFAATPAPRAFLFHGPTGSGKTCAAIALAKALDVRVEAGCCGGFRSVASGSQSAESVRDLARDMQLVPFTGSGWKVFVLNEADRMSPQAEAIWLDVLESLPPHTVVVFTTNEPERMSERFRDRCSVVPFDGAERSLSDLREFLRSIWTEQTGGDVSVGALDECCSAGEDGRRSFRRAVQKLQDLAETLDRR